MKKVVSDFKVGDTIIISGSPSEWDSKLSKYSPMRVVINYPFTCVIEAIEVVDTERIAMRAGGYGWSLDSLVKEKLISKEVFTLNFFI
jgi:hypothetical protein